MIKKLLVILLALMVLGCNQQGSAIFQEEADGSVTNYENDTHGTYASTYTPFNSKNIVIRNATVFDGNGNKFKNFDVHFSDGAIQAIGLRLVVEGAEEILSLIHI